MLAGETGAVELRAFAAPRNGDIWDDVRRQVARGRPRGRHRHRGRGRLGHRGCRCSLTVTRDDGQRVQQASKVIGIPGPRWLLRATLFGRPAVEHHEDGDVETALRDVVVVRGSTPVPPGDAAAADACRRTPSRIGHRGVTSGTGFGRGRGYAGDMAEGEGPAAQEPQQVGQQRRHGGA